ncbi:MAG TPA: glycosyltransferase family 39 protein [Vicinamibacterales bacterium]
MTQSTRLAAGVFAAAAAKLVLQLAAIRGYGPFRDEFYYIACSERLAFGYVDHPPLAPLITAASRLVLGDSIVALRIVPAVAGAVTVLLAGLIARELGARRFGQTVAALCVALAPQYLALNHIVSMNAYELVTWPLAALLVARIGRLTAEGQVPPLSAWVWLGIVVGLGLQNKLGMLFLAGGLAAGVVLSGARRLLLTRGPWVAAAIAGVIFLPHVVWQATHGWPTLEFIGNASRFKNLALPPAVFMREQILGMNPVTAPVWIAGLVWLLAAHAARPFRPLGIAYLAILLVFLLTAAKPYYLAPYYPVLLAAGGVVVDRALDLMRSRRVALAFRVAIIVLPLVSGLVLAPLALPILPVERYIRYAARLGIGPAPTERHQPGLLPQFYADMFGWQELVDAVERAASTLTPDERAKAVVYVNNYGEAGAINYLGRRRGLPRAISGHNNYWLWGPGDADGRVLLIVGGTAEEHDECATVEEVARARCTYCMPYESDLPVFVCRDLRAPIAEVWQAVKHYE